MPAKRSRWKALAAATLLIVSLGAGALAFTSDAPTDDRTTQTTTAEEGSSSTGSSSSAAPTSVDAAAPETVEPADFEGHVLERYTGSFDAAPSSGNLELLIDDGPVRVVGWDQASYEILVLQGNASEGQAVHDYETNVEFDDQSADGTLDLSVAVDRDGTYGVGVQTNEGGTEDPHRHRGIVAFVPASTSYDSVDLCSGQQHMFEQTWKDAWGAVPWPWEDDRDVDAREDCVPADDSPGFHAQIDTRFDRNGTSFEYSDDKPFDLETGAVGVEGNTLKVATGFGSANLQALDFSQVEAVSGHGHIQARDVAATNATYLAGHGDVVAPGASGGDLTVFAEHGRVAAGYTPSSVGTVSLTSDHGDVQLRTAPADGIGYDAKTGTDHGEMTLDISDATVERQERGENESSWQDPDHWLSLFEEDDTYEKTATATTDNWDTVALRTEVQALTEHGDVLVTDDADYPIKWDVGDDDKDEDEER